MNSFPKAVFVVSLFVRKSVRALVITFPYGVKAQASFIGASYCLTSPPNFQFV